MGRIPLRKIMKTPEGWTNAKVGDFLTDAQIKKVEEILKSPELEQIHKLKKYLSSIQPPLEEKGIIPDYLAYILYSLCHKTQ